MGETIKNDVILVNQLQNVLKEDIDNSKIYPKLLYAWDLTLKLLDSHTSFRDIGIKPALARGLLAELQCEYLLRHWATEKGLNFRIFSNLLIPRIDGGTTQIDLLFMTEDFGIMVECKSIYGKMTIKNGTIKSKTNSFKPWRQNLGHIASMQKVLEGIDCYLHNVVYIFSLGYIQEYVPVADEKLLLNVNSFQMLDSIYNDKANYHFKKVDLDKVENILQDFIPDVKEEIDHIYFVNNLKDKRGL